MSDQTRRAQFLVLAAAFLGWMFDGLEMGIFPLVARPALQQMQQAAGVVDEQFVQFWMGRITALFLLGAAAGGLIFGWLGDRIGRVRAMTLSILFYSIFTGLAYFAQQPWHLGALRFLGGRRVNFVARQSRLGRWAADEIHFEFFIFLDAPFVIVVALHSLIARAFGFRLKTFTK